MWVISKRTVLEFIERHPETREPMLTWHTLAAGCLAHDFHELKLSFGSADHVPPQYTVFDVGGNRFRIVAAIHYNRQSLFVRHVLTHAEYDLWTRTNRRK